MAEATAPPKPAAAPAPQRELPGEVTIEFADVLKKNDVDPTAPPMKKPRNRQVQFPPLRTVFRARWSRNSLTSSEANGENLESLPAEIPGICVKIDAKKATITVYDPLGLPEHKDLMAELKAKMVNFGEKNVGPWQTKQYPKQNPSQIKTALWWAWRMVNDGSAVVVAGSMPTEEQIEALPGKTRIEIYNNSARATKFREDLPREDWNEAREAMPS